jgi:hypothetical protein
MKVVTFKEYDCVLQYSQYMNGRTSIQLIDIPTCIPVATATVNIPDVELEEDEVIIKNYSENEGMSQALMDAGVISHPTKSIRQAHVIVLVHKLLTKKQIN